MKDSPLEVEICCQQIKRCIQIALKCVAANRHERPSIVDVTLMLSEIDILCTLPVDEMGNSEVSNYVSVNRTKLACQCFLIFVVVLFLRSGFVPFYTPNQSLFSCLDMILLLIANS
jgi:hypothetical protein